MTLLPFTKNERKLVYYVAFTSVYMYMYEVALDSITELHATEYYGRQFASSLESRNMPDGRHLQPSPSL